MKWVVDEISSQWKGQSMKCYFDEIDELGESDESGSQ